MHSRDLNRRQIDAISEKLIPTHGYLNRLKERMNKAGFGPTDPLYLDVVAASDAMHSLTVRLHYLGVRNPGR